MDYNPTIPIWVQVSTMLRRQICAGTLSPGSKLPGGRDLAAEYGINPNTAARVYQELEREGICTTKRGMGTFVTQDENKIKEVRTRMAGDAARAYLVEIHGLGLRTEDAIRMLETAEGGKDAEK